MAPGETGDHDYVSGECLHVRFKRFRKSQIERLYQIFKDENRSFQSQSL